MLTQGSAPDPKSKFIISSFLTLPHLLDCLICTRNTMPFVLLLQMMGGWDRWGLVDLYYGFGGGTGGGIILYLIFFLSCAFVFNCLMFSVPLFRWLEHVAAVSVSLFFLYFLCLWSL